MSLTGKRKRPAAYNVSNQPYKKQRRANMGTVTATRGFAANYGTYRKKGVKQELKVSDITTAQYAVNTTGTFTLLHVPILGTDYTQRIGRKTVIKSLYIRGRVLIENAQVFTAAITCAAQQPRMILFWDMQPNGAAPAVTDLLNTADSTSHLNLNNRDRFRIIKDKTFVFDPMVITAATAVANWNRTISDIKCYKKLTGEVIFNGTNGGTIADINSGALYMFWIGNVPAGTNDSLAVLSTRIRFDDA